MFKKVIFLKTKLMLLTIFYFRNKLNVKESINLITESWNNITETTIQNCWKKTGILPSINKNIDKNDMNNMDNMNNMNQESDFKKEIKYIFQNLLEAAEVYDYLQ